MGFTQRQTGARSTETLAERLAAVAELPGDQFANVRELGETFLLRHGEAQFDDGLTLLIEGIEARVRAKGDAAR
jgi:hypothetical protein